MKHHRKNHKSKIIVSNRLVMGILLIAFSITLLSVFMGAARFGNFGQFTGAAVSLGEQNLMISQQEENLIVKNGFGQPIRVVLYADSPDSEISSQCSGHLWVASQDKADEKGSCLSGLTENYLPLTASDLKNGFVVCDYLESLEEKNEMKVFFRADSGLEENCNLQVSLVAETTN